MFDMKIMVSKKIVSSVLYLVICVAITFLFFFLEKTDERPEPEPLLEVEQQMEYKDFLTDQARLSARVRKYCVANNLSRPLNLYLYSYDPKRNFLLCRNHKVISIQD